MSDSNEMKKIISKVFIVFVDKPHVCITLNTPQHHLLTLVSFHATDDVDEEFVFLSD